MCQILRETLEPIGFDAVRFRKLGENGCPSEMLRPMQYGQDGSWLLNWCGQEISEAAWELKLELITDAAKRWGYFSLVRVCNKDSLPLDVNMLTEEFRSSLTGAIERASNGLEESEKVGVTAEHGKTRSIAAGTMAD